MQGVVKSSNTSKLVSAMTLTKLGLTHVPQRYVLPSSQRPNLDHIIHSSSSLPIIDFSNLQNPSLRSHTLDEIQMACKEVGFFQVINHGIPLSVMNDALDATTEFFNLPMEEKMVYLSDNVHEPVRYGTSLNHVRDECYFWRDFIKHYSHPISDWPSIYGHLILQLTSKEKMGNYARVVQVLQKQLMEVILEILGLNRNYLQNEIEKGSQVLVANCYPECPEPDVTLGMPPRSDYGSITILLQSSPGLQVMDHNKNWLSVPVVEGALIVQLGDQMEVMSNGKYKSVMHRVTVNSHKKRLSIASLRSLALEKKIGPAENLLDKEHPASYKEFSFKDYLNYISNNDILTGERFIDTLKKNQ